MVQSRRSAANGVYRGAAGRERSDEELARSKARAEARKAANNDPFRFRIKPGGSTEYVILDDAPDFFRHEHNLQNPQTKIWDIYTGCTAEWDDCPVCKATGREPYYAMYLTVLDFTPFTTKDGQEHEFSRKLLVVKPAQQKKFLRAYDKAVKAGNTLRGAVFEVTRDTDKDSAIGNDIEFVEYMEEDDLATYTRTWTDRDNKKHTEDCSVPFNYDELFEEPDSEKLRALVGGEPSLGSREYERQAGTSRRGGRNSRNDDEGDDDSPRGRRAEGRGRGRDRDNDEGDEGYGSPSRRERMGSGRSRGGEDEQEAESRTESRRPRRGQDDEPPPRSSRRGRRDPSEDDAGEDNNDDDGGDTRTSRRSRREEPASRTRDAAPARGRRSSRDDEGADDDPPPGTRGRRVSMRGRS